MVRGYIKIIEAVVALILISAALLIVLNKNPDGNDVSQRVYSDQLTILRSIQTDDDLRNEILEIQELPVEFDSEKFPQEVKNKITGIQPDYLECSAKICVLDEICEMSEYKEGDVYVQSVGITATEDLYNPRQLKLFCWIK